MSTSKPYAQFFAWVAPDSTRVLGLGLSKHSAYEDAIKRHGPPAQGYTAMVTITDFPVNANPALALTHALWISCPPTLKEAGAGAPVEPAKIEAPEKAVNGKAKPKELKLEGAE